MYVVDIDLTKGEELIEFYVECLFLVMLLGIYATDFIPETNLELEKLFVISPNTFGWLLKLRADIEEQILLEQDKSQFTLVKIDPS